MGDKKVYTDGTRVVEMYHIYPAPHSNALTGRVHPEGEGPVPGRLLGEPRGGNRRTITSSALVPALEKLNLDFERYINVHASAAPQTKADVWSAVGK